RRFRRRHRASRRRRAREPRFPLQDDRAARRRGRGSVPAERSRARVAPLVLPVEPRPGRGTAAARRGRPARRSARADGAGRADARGSARREARDRVRAALARARRSRRRRACRRPLPALRRRAARGVRDRGRALPAQRAARGPERARAADGNAYVPERAPRAALRHRLRARAAVPARRARRPAPLRPARQSRRADAHVVRRPHVAGAARRMGSRDVDGNAARAAAAERRDGPLDAGGRGAAGRRARRRPDRAARGPARAARSARAGADREADDVRAEPRARALRHASGPGGRARGRAAGLPVLRDRRGDREERRVPHAGPAAFRRRAGDHGSCGRGRQRLSEGRSMAYLTKKHLSRRTVLRGAGVAIGLPLLDAMIPAATALAKTAAAPKLKAGFFYIPHGAIMWNTSHGPAMDRWTPSGAGESFRLSQIPEPLEPFKLYVVSLSNLENKANQNSVHSLVPATWLSGVRPDTRASGAKMATTIDQMIAERIGQDTPLPSLEVASETAIQAAACSTGTGGCYYSATLSFRNATSPLPMEFNPRRVFVRLFGEGDTPEEREAITRRT